MENEGWGPSEIPSPAFRRLCLGADQGRTRGVDPSVPREPSLPQRRISGPHFPRSGPTLAPTGGGGGYFFRDSPQRKSKLYPTPPIEYLFGLQTGVFVQRRSGPHRFVPYPHQLRILQFPFQKKWAPLDVNFAIKPNVTFECYSPHA